MGVCGISLHLGTLPFPKGELILQVLALPRRHTVGTACISTYSKEFAGDGLYLVEGGASVKEQ